MIIIFHKDSVCDFGCNPLYFPEYRLVSFCNLIDILRGPGELLRNGHIQNGNEKLDPGVQHALLHQIGRHLKLIGLIKYFADQIQNVKCILVFFVADLIIHDDAQYLETSFDDFV